MRGVIGIGVKLVVLAAVVVGGGWLAWKSLGPSTPGVHEVVAPDVAEAKAGSSPKIGNCMMLPADNVWNTPIDKVKKDARSQAYINSIGTGAKLHPDFGTSSYSGIPFSDLPPNTKSVPIAFDYHDESDLGNYPIPPDAPIEGGPNSTGDRHIILVDQRRCVLYEIFAAFPKPDGSWTAGSGEKYDMTTNALRAEGRGSADAAGMMILPGLIRYDEVAAGEIDHAIRFTIPHTQGAFIWPARHKASRIADPNVPPMGLRLRLRQDFDISSYSKANQVILTALKRYGIILADNGGPMFLNGVPDKRWDDADLHRLTDITAADFEVIDESELQMLPDSARVDPMALAAAH